MRSQHPTEPRDRHGFADGRIQMVEFFIYVDIERRYDNFCETPDWLFLFRLLQKRQYDEAVEFAKQFDLDVQHVYKVKCTNIAILH